MAGASARHHPPPARHPACQDALRLWRPFVGGRASSRAVPGLALSRFACGGASARQGQAPRALSGTGAAEPALRCSLGPATEAVQGGVGRLRAQVDLRLGARAAPGCGRKSFPNCGKRQGLKPHGNSPFARRRKEEGESLKAEVPPHPAPGIVNPHWVDLISLLPLWASISPFVGAGFGSALELVAGPKAVGHALDRRFSPTCSPVPGLGPWGA